MSMHKLHAGVNIIIYFILCTHEFSAAQQIKHLVYARHQVLTLLISHCDTL